METGDFTYLKKITFIVDKEIHYIWFIFWHLIQSTKIAENKNICKHFNNGDWVLLRTNFALPGTPYAPYYAFPGTYAHREDIQCDRNPVEFTNASTDWL